MKKTLFTILFSCLMAITSGITVFAQEPASMAARSPIPVVVKPLWNDTAYASPTVSINGTTVTAFVDVGAYNSNASCNGTLYLERYASGKWTTVTWTRVSGTGSATASVSATGVRNNSYRARIYVKVGSDTLTNTSRTETVK